MERLRCLSASIKLTLRGVNCTDSDENCMGVMDGIAGRDEVVANDFENFLKNDGGLDGGWVEGKPLEGAGSDPVEEDGVEYVALDF